MIIENNTVKILFDETLSFSSDVTIQTIDNFLSQLIEFYQSNENKIVDFNFKQLSFDIRKYIIEKTIDLKLIDTILLRNVLVLLRSNCQLTDEFFSFDNTLVNSLEEFLDMKLQLSDKLKTFKTEVAYWFLSCIKSMSTVEINFLSNAKKMPKNIQQIFLCSDMITLSSIFNTANSINTADLVLVENAHSIMSSLICKQQIANAIIKLYQ